MQLAQALGGGGGVVGPGGRAVGEGLLETLLADQGTGTGGRGRDVLQGGGGR